MDQTVQEQAPQPVVQPQATQEVASQPPVIPTSPDVPETPSRPPRKFPFVIIIVLIFLLAGGILAYFWLQQPKPEPTPKVSFPATTAQPTKVPVTPYVGTQTITLRDITGGSSSGTATRTLTVNSAAHSVSTSLPDPGNDFYQAWVSKPGGRQILLGRLTKSDEGEYKLESKYDFPQSRTATFEELSNTVIISLEKVDDDQMETIIFQGEFTR